MPTIPLESKVLVTGANGYIASWIVRTLLDKGYSVRGTVRSEEKRARMKEIFQKQFGYGDERLEFVIVSDMAKEGAFDEAVTGVDAILHTASPVILNSDDPQDLIQPAVRGTVGILQSALNSGNDVQRIVLTSSCATILEIHPGPPRTFSELDWNTQAVEEVDRLGKGALPINKYRASKTLAEQAAWKFVEDHKAQIKWDLVVINPPYVFGPVIHDVPTPSALNDTTALFYNTVVQPNAGGKSHEELRTGNCWVDVRDLGEAHVLALVKEGVANERVIISAEGWVWQEWLDIANSLQPTHLPSHPNVPKGKPITPGDDVASMYKINYNTSKASRLLGIKQYRTKQENVRDTFDDYEKRGW